MNHWRDRYPEIEDKLKALNQADFGLSYGEELLRSVQDYSTMKVIFGGTPSAPISAILALASETLASSTLPNAIAKILFGNETLVFDVASRLRGVCNPQAAIMGAHPGVELEDNKETLIDFVVRNPSCVVIYDDLQAFDPWVISNFASMIETGEMQNSCDAPFKEVIFMATLRVNLPSPMQLDQFARFRSTSEFQAPFDGDEGELDKYSFERTIVSWVSDQYPEYFRALGHFSLLTEHLHETYINSRQEGSVEIPLLKISDPSAALWDRKRVTPPKAPAPWEYSPQEITSLLRMDSWPDNLFHVFISYHTSRDSEAAEWLNAALGKRGFKVFLDTKTLNVGAHPENEIKARLITEFFNQVRASHCTIAFALGMESFQLPSGMTEDEAVNLCLAMRAYDGKLIKWNWQKLETDYSLRVLVLDRTRGTAYSMRGGIVENSFGTHSFECNDQMFEIVLSYLRHIGISV